MVDELAADISTNSQGHKMVAFDIPNEILQKGQCVCCFLTVK